MRDEKAPERKLKDTHIKQSDRKLAPGCTIMFYLLPPHAKPTGKYIGPVKRNGKDKICWSKVHWGDGDTRTNAQLTDDRRLKSNKIADLKEGQWTILDATQEEKVCANAL